MTNSRIISPDQVKKLRAFTGLSQARFGEKYGIPKRTIENWESGASSIAPYIFNLLERVVIEDFKTE